jgi:hypothetical protein
MSSLQASVFIPLWKLDYALDLPYPNVAKLPLAMSSDMLLIEK